MEHYFFIFILGLIAGSFANVCIFRIPAGRSVVMPASKCVNCGSNVLWYDNIPVLSYLILRGRCRHCSEKISIQYIIIEAISGIMFVLLALRFKTELLLMIMSMLFFMLMLIIAGIDYKHQIIPFCLSIPLIIASLSVSPLNALLGPEIKSRIINSAAAFAGGWIVLFGIGWATKIVIKKEALGGGDPILLAGIGAFIGWKGAVVALFLASLSGLLIMLFMIIVAKRDKNKPFPFGPFLAAGAMGYILLNEYNNVFFEFLLGFH